MFHADRNVRPCTILGYTLTTFPKKLNTDKRNTNREEPTKLSTELRAEEPCTLPVKIALYPSLESLNEEPKDELTETEHEYYDRKRKILVEKMAIANDVYLAHLQNYDKEDPKNKSQKFLFQFNEVGNRLHKQFNIVAERLRLPLEQPLMTYPSLGNLMDAIQQEDMGDKNREYFQEMAKEIKIKDDIAQKVLNNRLSVIRTPAEKGKTNLQYEEYKKESKKLLDL